MKNKGIVTTVVFALILAIVSLACFFKPHTMYSHSERRFFAEKPTLSLSTVASGEFMGEFENYTVDQFPLRDKLRRIKAMFATYVFGKKDNNGLYTADGHISKIDYPVNEQMVDHAKEKFDYLYETYMKDKSVNIYLSIVPDKNHFLAKDNGYLSIDYEKFADDFKNRVDYMTYIDIMPYLSLDDYYRTDSHWKQENIVDIAEHIAGSMGAKAKSDYTVNTLQVPFEGVYLGQSALPYKPDTIKYLTSDVLSNCKVTYYDSGAPKIGDMYNMEKAYDKDPYEMFLSGSSPLVTIENLSADTEKELILFRDSFGSSIAPILSTAYSKVTVVDIRYLQSSFIGNFVEFDNQDVLFLYSTSLLNNSLSMR